MHKRLLIAAGLIGLALSVNGVTYKDIDIFGTQGVQLKNQPLTDIFNISNSDGEGGDVVGFNPVTEMVSSATAYFSLKNNQSGEVDTYSIDLSDEAFLSGIVTEKTPITVFGNLNVTLLAELNTLGQIEYTVQEESGASLKLMWAELDAVAGPKPVPDGSMTVALLALALAGLGSLGRRKT